MEREIRKSEGELETETSVHRARGRREGRGSQGCGLFTTALARRSGESLALLKLGWAAVVEEVESQGRGEAGAACARLLVEEKL